MVQAQQQFTPRQILEAGQRAVAEGRIDYARQFFQHLIDHYADSAEAASARNEMLSLGPTRATPPLAANAPDLRVAETNGRASAPPQPPPRPPQAPPAPRSRGWAHPPAPERPEPSFDRTVPREPLVAREAERWPPAPPEQPPPMEVAPPVQARRLAPLPEKHYIAGRVFTGLLGLLGVIGLPLGLVMLYGVFADPSLFGIIGVTRFTEALGLSALVFLGSIALIIVAQTARAIFDAADAASDLVRLERYRLGLDDDDN
jgi:hypothetical protein